MKYVAESQRQKTPLTTMEMQKKWIKKKKQNEQTPEQKCLEIKWMSTDCVYCKYDLLLTVCYLIWACWSTHEMFSLPPVQFLFHYFEPCLFVMKKAAAVWWFCTPYNRHKSSTNTFLDCCFKIQFWCQSLIFETLKSYSWTQKSML